MEREPLLPLPRPSLPSLCSLPEDDVVSIPLPLTPSELKDRLIFGPPPSSPRDPLPFCTASPPPQPPPQPPPSCSHQEFSPVAHDSPVKQQQQHHHLQLYRNFHRCKTAPALAVINDLQRHPAAAKRQLGSQPVVRQAVVLLLLYLCSGVVIFWVNRENFSRNETHPFVDALYFCIVTMCTIGYGDIVPNTCTTKLFSILFVLVGFGFVDILLSGMVGYVLDLQESYLLRNVKRGVRQDAAGSSYIFDVKKGRMRIRMKVAFALGVVVLCIGTGVAIAHFVEKIGWLDSFYLSVMSVTTVGYGDGAFSSLQGRIFASIWLLVSTLAVARAFLYLVEARVDKHQRRMEKLVLGQNMTVSQFLAADIDHNGFVSKSEYVVYKLKEMGKVTENDIFQIIQKFDRLDTGNCGKISLVDLMGSDH